MIWLNSENVRHLPTPFGGMKSSASAATARLFVRLLHGNQARLAGAGHPQDSEAGIPSS